MEKNPAALKKVTKAVRNVPQLENAVEAAVKAAANDAVRAVAGEMSTAAYFHRLGNMEFYRSPSGQSLEQLEQAARALGMTEYNVKNWPTHELEEFVTTATVFSNVAKQCDLPTGEESLTRDDVNALPLFMEHRYVEFVQWVNSQPDFYEDNYVPLNYREKFHPDVK